ncbi:MAG: ester cyclase [Chloroflexota bacterium]
MSADQQTIDRNVAATRRLFEEGFTHGNADVCDELVSADAIEHQRGLKAGIDGAKETIRTLHQWFSDFELIIDDLVAQDDQVWIRATGRGLNTGSIFGRPPTGRRMEITVFDQIRFRDGQLVDHWGVPDQLGLLMQLGLFGRPEPAAVAG